MSGVSNIELIQLATEVMGPKMIGGYKVGQVGCALVTDKGTIFKGVCMDMGSGLGFCAERTAISQMLTNKEYKVKKIVAVWNDNPEKDLHVLPPCGVCRQYMSSLCEDSMDIDVIMSNDKVIKLAELLPFTEWPEKEKI